MVLQGFQWWLGPLGQAAWQWAPSGLSRLWSTDLCAYGGVLAHSGLGEESLSLQASSAGAV